MLLGLLAVIPFSYLFWDLNGSQTLHVRAALLQTTLVMLRVDPWWEVLHQQCTDVKTWLFALHLYL